MKLEGFTPYDPGDAERYNRLRWWLGITWGDLFDKATDLYPGKVGLVDDIARYTYAGAQRQGGPAGSRFNWARHREGRSGHDTTA